MTITNADIKLLASARMTDAADGGGAMTGNVLQDGLENNVFPDVSTLDRAAGALQFRKIFPAVLSANADALLGGHVILDTTPTDPAVSCVMVPGASAGQQLSQLVEAMNAAAATFGYRGTAYLTAALASGATLAAVGSTFAQLIPKTTLTTPVTGNVATSADAGGMVLAWEDSGQTVALTCNGSTSISCQSQISSVGGHIKAGSVSGTFTAAAGGAGTVTSDLEGNVILTAPAPFGTVIFSQYFGARSWGSSGAPSAISAFVVTGQVMVEVGLPKRVLRVPVVAGRTTYTINLPPAVALSSVSFTYQILVPPAFGGGGLIPATISVPPADGVETWGTLGGTYPILNFAKLARSTGVLTLVFQSALVSNTEIVVTYAAGGQTTPLPGASLGAGGAIAAGAASVSIGGGLVFGGAVFYISGGEAGLNAIAGVIKNGGGVVRGVITDAGAMTIPANDGLSIRGWYAVQRNPQVSVSSVDAVLRTSLSPTTLVVSGTITAGAAFTATASAAGVFATAQVTGTYSASTGSLRLTFNSPVDLASLTYAADQLLPQTSTADLRGLIEDHFPADGKVQILHAGDVVVLQNTAETAPAAAVVAGTVNCGRTDLATVRVFGNNGAAISNGWTADLSTGILTWTNVTGFSQPVRVRHSIEHVAVAGSVPNTLSVQLNRAPTRSFAAGSTLSSAMLLADMQARAGLSFSQESWGNVWSDTRIGSAIAAQYQQVAHPVVVSNLGAITERWAFIFTSSTAYRLVGETLGQIATGDVNTDFSPINPATGAPLFTIAATGWGIWSAGNVLRLNTTGANAPIWAARATLPSVPGGLDKVTFALRGDIDAP